MSPELSVSTGAAAYYSQPVYFKLAFAAIPWIISGNKTMIALLP
jgi:hypothetical protein